MVKLHFETLTPLHISNGNELAHGLEYTIRNDVFRKYNFGRISKILADKNSFDFNKEISVREIVKVIEDNFDIFKLEDFQYKIPIHPKFHALVNNDRAIGQKYVQEFINQNGKFYIPGSSVKGALLTILRLNQLGISNDDNANIADKFVIRDSEYLEQENFIVLTTESRPPSINLICLKPNMTFVIDILKLGKLNKNNLAEKLTVYSKNQLNLALKNLKPYKGIIDRPKGADIFEEGLEKIRNIQLQNGEYLINLGFGGGSWFKVFENIVPKFKSKSRARIGQDEPAHTSFSVFLKRQTNHIGWCKLKISE